MKTQNNSRKDFIKKTATIAGSIGPEATISFAKTPKKIQYKIRQWKGFNLLDLFSPNPNKAWESTKEEHFNWMSDWGFDFVRIPMVYTHT